MKMVEKIARALYAVGEGHVISDELWAANADHSVVAEYREFAKAALAAMETPTPDMVEAGRNPPMPLIKLDSISGQERLRAKTIWSAMIAKAREG